jgi:hypothetical protein
MITFVRKKLMVACSWNVYAVFKYLVYMVNMDSLWLEFADIEPSANELPARVITEKGYLT